MAWDTSPLLARRQTNDQEQVFSVNCGADEDDDGSISASPYTGTTSSSYGPHAEPSPGTLTTFEGVFSPVSLSMFSTALFLRLGFVIGQSGLLYTLVQFALSYLILYLTILSICAISTNGRIKGGGAYYMISRSLGPEFGGSIGLLFFLANVFSCAVYVSGFVEVLVDNFGTGGSYMTGDNGLLIGNSWWIYLYASVVLFLCLLISMTGGAIFAKTSVFTFMIVIGVIISVFISSFVVSEKCVEFPDSNPLSHHVIPVNSSNSSYPLNCAYYTGFSVDTFYGNLYSNYTVDYVTGHEMNFAVVFAILFSSVTGIMNGANMSGELKNPSRSIPIGTLSAATFVLSIYIGLTLLISATCDRDLLLNNYIFLQSSSMWSPLIVIGIFATTLSAALGNLIGASRVLEALANDQVFWSFLKPATITTKSGNPIISVVMSWFLVQLVLLIGSLNAIAPMASALFLLSYAATNIACLGLHLTSAPNFRPTFRYFSTPTALGGLAGAMIMCFVISMVYASVALLCCLLLVIVLHLRDYPRSWGSISQAIIFHQVRKYLLLLDPRKDHVKYWRPQMLLLVRDLDSSSECIDLINDMKKSGLYVIGHVKIGSMDTYDKDPCIDESLLWMNAVDTMKVKAFIEITLTESIREGIASLIRVAGLGGMKPNTICIGFNHYNCTDSQIYKSKTFKDINQYLTILRDIHKLNKNICVLRGFSGFQKSEIFKNHGTIDVWPQDFLSIESRAIESVTFDPTSLFMLQLGCILAMVPAWRGTAKLRLFFCIDSTATDAEVIRFTDDVTRTLSEIRVKGEVCLLTVAPGNTLLDYNRLLQRESEGAAVLFTYLPRVTDASQWHRIDALTYDLPPTILVHGEHEVVSTTL